MRTKKARPSKPSRPATLPAKAAPLKNPATALKPAPSPGSSTKRPARAIPAAPSSPIPPPSSPLPIESAPVVAPAAHESAPVISPPPRPAPPPIPTIGRDVEREILLRNVASGFATAILGRPGIGKTHLLHDLKRALIAQGRAVIHAEMESARETGRAVYEGLCRLTKTEPRKWKAGITVAEEIAQIVELLNRFKPKEIVLLLDGAEHAPIKAEPLLRLLSERCVVVVAAIYVRRSKRIQRFFWQFERLELKPLSTADSRRLAEAVLARLPHVRFIEEKGGPLRRLVRRFFPAKATT